MYDEGLLQRCLDALDSLNAGPVRDKNVFGMRGLMRGARMFAAVGEDEIIVKMTPGAYASALAQEGVTPFAPGGDRLGNWVQVPGDLVADDPELRDWLAAGLRGLD